MLDARARNWRFLVPHEPPGMLLLPNADELAEPAALAAPTELADLSGSVLVPPGPDGAALLPVGRFPAVGASDLAAGTRGGTRRQSLRLLTELAAAVAPGGWLCVGFANARYPRSPLSRGSLPLPAVRRTLHRAGLATPAVYAALPDHRHPALLVPLARPAELTFALTHLVPTYEPAGARWPRLRRRMLQAQRWAALAAPHQVRSATVPAYCLLARRPP